MMNYGLKRVVVRKSKELVKIQIQLVKEQIQTEKLEALKILAQGIAHDFNNYLTIISGNLDLLQMQEKLSPEIQDSLRDISFAASSARGLTKQLKIFSAKSEINITKEDILPILKETAKIVTSGTKCNFSLVCDFEKLCVHIDHSQMVQVFTNLILNAVQAMPDGGKITISVKIFHNTLESSLKLTTGKYVQIAIKDEGIGISKEDLTKIFEPYHTTKEKGTGLGLAISRTIIENHGGKIFFISEKNVGSTFTIYLHYYE
jgi:signal transduction histidine kinase